MNEGSRSELGGFKNLNKNRSNIKNKYRRENIKKNDNNKREWI